MSTLDEITKEKQRVGDALARVDAQREQLVSQLHELEATERVLARYTKGTPARRTSSAKMPTKVPAPATPAPATPAPMITMTFPLDRAATHYILAPLPLSEPSAAAS